MGVRRRTTNSIELFIYELSEFAFAIEFKIEKLENTPDVHLDNLYYEKPFFYEVCNRMDKLEIPFFYNIINNNLEFYKQNENSITEYTQLLIEKLRLFTKNESSLESMNNIFSSCAIYLHSYLNKLVNDSGYELKEEKENENF